MKYDYKPEETVFKIDLSVSSINDDRSPRRYSEGWGKENFFLRGTTLRTGSSEENANGSARNEFTEQ